MVTLTKLTIAGFSSFSCAEKLALAAVITEEKEFAKTTRADLAAIIGRPLPRVNLDFDRRLRRAQETEKQLRQQKIEALVFDSCSYPPQLREIYDPPYVLYLRGNSRALQPFERILAIVGSRQCSERQKRDGFSLAFNSAEYKLTVVSGLALGVDAAAHQGALAGGAKTVAVLAGGLEKIYPHRHEAIGRRILTNEGAFVSEQPPFTPPVAHLFPRRNRLISGLSRGVAVVGVPFRSGALITAHCALRQNRDLYFIASASESITDESEQRQTGEYQAKNRPRGAAAFIADGAPLIASIKAIADDWKLRRQHDFIPKPSVAGRSGQYKSARWWLCHSLQLELSGNAHRYRGELFVKGSGN